MMTLIGLIILSGMNIYSRRVIHRIWLHRDRSKLTIEFFNAFWKPKVATHYVTELADPRLSYGRFTRLEITSVGNVWIMPESNIYADNVDMDRILREVLTGNSPDLGSDLFIKHSK